jgi:hypothetical protein
MAARNHPRRFPAILVANGLDRDDISWLRKTCADIPLVSVTATFDPRSRALLPHGAIIDLVASARKGPFCLQDADCFVSDVEFWESIQLDEKVEYASGPFIKVGDVASAYPETYFVCVNGDLLVRYGDQYGITSAAGPSGSTRANEALARAGFLEGMFPESSKNYFDTLQQFWVLAIDKGYRFRYLDGAGKTIHHIGGTSYLHAVFNDLAKWDYLPLNVHYFHLKLLEHPSTERFRRRFKALINYHGTTESLLDSFPEFRDGWRRKQTDMILGRID